MHLSIFLFLSTILTAETSKEESMGMVVTTSAGPSTAA